MPAPLQTIASRRRLPCCSCLEGGGIPEGQPDDSSGGRGVSTVIKPQDLAQSHGRRGAAPDPNRPAGPSRCEHRPQRAPGRSRNPPGRDTPVSPAGVLSRPAAIAETRPGGLLCVRLPIRRAPGWVLRCGDQTNASPPRAVGCGVPPHSLGALSSSWCGRRLQGAVVCSGADPPVRGGPGPRRARGCC